MNDFLACNLTQEFDYVEMNLISDKVDVAVFQRFKNSVVDRLINAERLFEEEGTEGLEGYIEAIRDVLNDFPI